MKKSFWKKAVAVVAAAGLATFALAGCSGSGAASSASSAATSNEDNVIRVGASPTPHAEILGAISDELSEQGYTLDIVEYNDYVLPNTALQDGEIDANYFQHITYMNNYNEENGTHLVSVGAIHYEPFGLYPSKAATLAELSDGALIGVPNDTTNEARALLLLEQAGLITLKDGVGINATKLDIVDNPKHLELVELEAAQLTSRLADLDLAVINGNYAIGAGLSITQALAVEASDGAAAEAYCNVLSVKEGSENNEAIQALLTALQSDEVKTFIEETYSGGVVPLF